MRYMDDYWVYPWPVEIVNEASDWAWLGPVLAFVGSALLFAGGLIGVWCTNRTANKRHREQLDLTRAEGRADRAAERNDRFREEVANLLGERWTTEKAAYKLAENAEEYYNGLNNPTVNAVTIAQLLQVRDDHTPQLNKVEHLAIRAALLMNDPQISEVLNEIRTAAQGWKNLVAGDHYGTFIGIRDRLDAAFERLEVLTRRLVTSDGAA